MQPQSRRDDQLFVHWFSFCLCHLVLPPCLFHLASPPDAEANPPMYALPSKPTWPLTAV